MKCITTGLSIILLLAIGNFDCAEAQEPQQPPIGGLTETRQAQEPVEPPQAMRNLIRDISKYARSFNQNFFVVTEGGLEILEKEDAVDSTRISPATTYMRSIDGINIQGLNFHPPLDGKAKDKIVNDKKIRANMLRLADIATNHGLKVFVTDFGANVKVIEQSYNFNLAKGFVTFTAQAYGSEFIFNDFPRVPSRPVNENPKNIVGLKEVQNFLHLTDSSRFDRQQDFVIALSNTNFDAIIVDVFHKGRKPFGKAAVQGMKFKRLGARRLVFAYMNIGIAENYRYYWRKNWKEGDPVFVASPVLGNPDKYYVEYWRSGWKKIITGNTKSYIYGIVNQGYDGVIIGGVDSFKYFETGG